MYHFDLICLPIVPLSAAGQARMALVLRWLPHAPLLQFSTTRQIKELKKKHFLKNEAALKQQLS